MAAGLGEASAIFAVADAGLKFSTTLLEYIREAKGAPAQINRIANVIETTSEQLKQVGQLIDNNVRRKVLSDSGVSSAQRCSDECNQILKTLRMTLCKNGWQQNFGDANADIDISLWSAMQWPFIKPKLEAPRAELDRIKLDLTFILTLASVLQA
ncbi:hypothetical protein EV356DRAFT_312280 [Viridothelium virens]|uniref:Fungal N-terminal domain-containing protein n=1 Tax=Viridothelium virens TaxID=1048519 RepID=A0A6A6GZ52_VIRVR|nr:hypothetical protein EV356DRAFT_312280 [Viridothelium virens]